MRGSTEMFGGRARERWILASLSGVLNGIGFIYLGEASLVANVPLLYALVCSRSYWESASLSAWVGFLGGVHIYGIINYGWFLLLGFSLYTASQMFVYGALFRLLCFLCGAHVLPMMLLLCFPLVGIIAVTAAMNGWT